MALQISYDDVFSSFLGYVNDYQIASLNMDDAYDLMVEYLHKAYAKPYVRRLFINSTMDDEIHTFTFTMAFPIDDDADFDFTVDILAKGMVIEWLHPQVKNKINLTQMITSSKESKFYAQANHLSELRSLLEDVTLDQRKMIRDRGWINNEYLTK